ncbi:MAG: hypothetical protein JRC57_02465, partial [Deltaproteobacteria bacterium]|nr:hypothetical protein [Deltaproteobacteria bacterium]
MLNKKIIILICILAFVVFAIYSLNRYKRSYNELTVNELPSAIKNSPSPEDSKGEAIVIPSNDVVANTYGTWKIVYTAGKGGIAIGGGVALHISPFWGWTPPQNSNQDYPGYTTVSTSNDKAKLDLLVGYPHYIVKKIKDVPLTYKQSITITYGDTGEGKHPFGQARCDKYAEDGEEFFIKVDGDGDGHFYPI